MNALSREALLPVPGPKVDGFRISGPKADVVRISITGRCCRLIKGSQRRNGLAIFKAAAATPPPLPDGSPRGRYRRELPATSIALDSAEGQKLFLGATEAKNAASFLRLLSCFNTQNEPEYCGLASLSMVLNALEIDPGRIWKGNWRWFDEAMLVTKEELSQVKKEGITLGRAASVARSNGGKVLMYRTNETNFKMFRSFVSFCTSVEHFDMILSYDRRGLKQSGAGHFSPIGAYHAGCDMALILDVARYKYRPHWVPLDLLWDAMNTIDESSGDYRGFMIVSTDDSEELSLPSSKNL